MLSHPGVAGDTRFKIAVRCAGNGVSLVVDNLALVASQLMLIIVLWRCFMLPADDANDETANKRADKTRAHPPANAPEDKPGVKTGARMRH